MQFTITFSQKGPFVKKKMFSLFIITIYDIEAINLAVCLALYHQQLSIDTFAQTEVYQKVENNDYKRQRSISATTFPYSRNFPSFLALCNYFYQGFIQSQIIELKTLKILIANRTRSLKSKLFNR